jgi:riboflavin kinase, archaea type
VAQRTENGLNLKNLTFRGAVITGKGNGKRYLSLPWVKQQIEEKLGFTPYAGTLNLRLTAEGAKLRSVLLKAETKVVCPAEGYCVGALFAAAVTGLECGVVIPEVATYPKNLLEVIAPVNLREQLRIEDGDQVEVVVCV